MCQPVVLGVIKTYRNFEITFDTSQLKWNDNINIKLVSSNGFKIIETVTRDCRSIRTQINKIWTIVDRKAKQ